MGGFETNVEKNSLAPDWPTRYNGSWEKSKDLY